MAYILLYVDDIILITSSHDLCKSITTLLASEFAMKDLGSLSYFLGIAVTKHVGGLFLSQSNYAREIIARAGMASCKPSATLVDTKQKLSTSADTPYDDPTLYRSLCRSLAISYFHPPRHLLCCPAGLPSHACSLHRSHASPQTNPPLYLVHPTV